MAETIKLTWAEFYKIVTLNSVGKHAKDLCFSIGCYSCPIQKGCHACVAESTNTNNSNFQISEFIQKQIELRNRIKQWKYLNDTEPTPK